jgi:hypothetical protein
MGGLMFGELHQQDAQRPASSHAHGEPIPDAVGAGRAPPRPGRPPPPPPPPPRVAAPNVPVDALTRCF